jgi:UDPglucose 6-dehydrogenase
MEGAEVIFIAVGTPQQTDGSVDLNQVWAAARAIGDNIHQYVIVAAKSTVPVGTVDRIAALIRESLAARNVKTEFDAISNPEFLKEGAAVNDFMRPDRIVIGSPNDRATGAMRRLYAPFIRNRELLLVMGVRDAEMTKYAANAMLATRISFINEIAALCEKTGVDIELVRKGIGSDSRIGYPFIYPGCGYGGSCFPKDVQALIQIGREHNTPMSILEMVHHRNNLQKRRLFEKVTQRFGPDLKGLVFGLWGLAFKPDTDDIREASSLVLASLLIEAGASVRAYDPVAVPNFQSAVPPEWLAQGKLQFVEEQYEALRGANALLLVTEWRQFRNLDVECIRGLMAHPVVFDGRNQYDPAFLRDQGFEYFGIGR